MKTIKIAFIFVILVNLVFVDQVIGKEKETIMYSKYLSIDINLKSTIPNNEIFMLAEHEPLNLNSVNSLKNIENQSVTKVSDPKNLTIWGQLIPVSIISTFVSAIVTITIYLLNRRVAKKQIKFDLALKSILPTVYVPLLNELHKKNNLNEDIDFHRIKRIILENKVLLNFAPKKLNTNLDELYRLCKGIDSPKMYKQLEPQVIITLTELEKLILKQFGALKG